MRLANGYYTYVAPFRISGYMIIDANGRTIAEAETPEIALFLAKMLNENYG